MSKKRKVKLCGLTANKNVCSTCKLKELCKGRVK